jgi:hypothetical protein
MFLPRNKTIVHDVDAGRLAYITPLGAVAKILSDSGLGLWVNNLRERPLARGL